MPEQEQEQEETTDGFFRRHQDYVTLYANNVQFQPWEWDLRITFGELDVHKNKLVVEQHTAINVSWLQAKLMLYFLQLQVGIHEMANGKIKIPYGVFPPEPTPPTGDIANDPAALRVYEYIRDRRAELVRDSAAAGS